MASGHNITKICEEDIREFSRDSASCLFRFMSMIEPNFKKAACAYCGDAPVSHRLVFFGNLFSPKFNSQTIKLNSSLPDFMGGLADKLAYFLFDLLLFFRILTLSDDINKTKTFRSRVIWEEAQRRGIEMKQLMFLGRASDEYMARINGRKFYFTSLPIPAHKLRMKKHWDDKFVLKEELSKEGIPVPKYAKFSVFEPNIAEKVFSTLSVPIIVKPRSGSRGRHTSTNINTKNEFQEGMQIASVLSPYLVAEEHLEGYVCRATTVNGKLVGFYRGVAPAVVGDGVKTITELATEKNYARPERVEEIALNKELMRHVERSGYKMEDVLPKGKILKLSHRTGRLFGGETKEMLPELHPSFVPILEKAGSIVGLSVIGFDCIIPDPEQLAENQKWGIIECNTLPFIDLHYYARVGKPAHNIAGLIWDLRT